MLIYFMILLELEEELIAVQQELGSMREDLVIEKELSSKWKTKVPALCIEKRSIRWCCLLNGHMNAFRYDFQKIMFQNFFVCINISFD